MEFLRNLGIAGAQAAASSVDPVGFVGIFLNAIIPTAGDAAGCYLKAIMKYMREYVDVSVSDHYPTYSINIRSSNEPY